MKLLAHITEINGECIEQTLYDHSIHTAEYAAESLKNTGMYHTAYLAGLLHDFGKATEKYNQYLQDAFLGKDVLRGSVNHSFAGVIYILEKYHSNNLSEYKWERMTSEIIAYAIGSHHGLFDCVDLDANNGFAYRLKTDRKELCYKEAFDNFLKYVAAETVIEEYFKKATEEVQKIFYQAQQEYKNEKTFFQISLLTRIILSSVINGDRRDTCEFMNQKKRWTKDEVIWSEQIQFFEKKISEFDSSTELNQARAAISQQCRNAAERPIGIYRLNVPTGGGKTLAALRYALAHAEKYKKKRIIFIIPLLSILDQNVKIIKEYLSDTVYLLEHHSNVVCDVDSIEELDNYELVTENWDAPVIVSTLVQFLNILFKQNTSAVRRMQALNNSVIVIDEIQSIPKKTIAMFNLAMNFLQQFCNTTIVLSSATQPCLDEVKWPIKLAAQPDMVSLKSEQYKVFARAEILDCTTKYGMDWEECCEFCSDLVKSHLSLLIICNTKSEARLLFEKIKNKSDFEEVDLFHLSTAMCQAHRLEVLASLHEKLKRIQKKDSTKKLICISTQLVEAGVDFSFDGVVRVLAGIDNLAQAAGRCNRSNEYNRLGKVYLINLKKENLSMLPDIQNAQNSTRKVAELLKRSKGESLIGDKVTRKYYQYLFMNSGDEIKYPIKDWNTKLYLADLWANCNGNALTEENKTYIFHQPFKTIGKEFKVFENNTIDVLVPYKEGMQIIQQIRNMQNGYIHLEKLEQLIQLAKKYTISIFQYQKEKLDEESMLEYVLDGRIMVLNQLAYDECCGLTDKNELPTECFVL